MNGDTYMSMEHKIVRAHRLRGVLLSVKARARDTKLGGLGDEVF